jgi:hypothetical protein
MRNRRLKYQARGFDVALGSDDECKRWTVDKKARAQRVWKEERLNETREALQEAASSIGYPLSPEIEAAFEQVFGVVVPLGIKLTEDRGVLRRVSQLLVQVMKRPNALKSFNERVAEAESVMKVLRDNRTWLNLAVECHNSRCLSWLGRVPRLRTQRNPWVTLGDVFRVLATFFCMKSYFTAQQVCKPWRHESLTWPVHYQTDTLLASSDVTNCRKHIVFLEQLIRDQRLCGLDFRGVWPHLLERRAAAVSEETSTKQRLPLDVMLWCPSQDREPAFVRQMIDDVALLGIPLRSLTFARESSTSAVGTQLLWAEISLFLAHSATLRIVDFSHSPGALGQLTERNVDDRLVFAGSFPNVETVILNTGSSTEFGAPSIGFPLAAPFLVQWFPAVKTLVFATDDLRHLKLLPGLARLQNLQIHLVCRGPLATVADFPLLTDHLSTVMTDTALSSFAEQPRLRNVEWMPSRWCPRLSPGVFANFSKLWFSRLDDSKVSTPGPRAFSVRPVQANLGCKCLQLLMMCPDCRAPLGPGSLHPTSCLQSRALF